MKRRSGAGYCAVFPLLLFALAACASEKTSYALSDLQGAWWSNPENRTADFAISGTELWLDFDSRFRPCRISGGDTLVYDLHPGLGTVERKILSLEGDTLVLEDTVQGKTTRTTYRRQE